ncbi:MAG: PEP-utilizing enzyme [Myxococcota bacterium]
MASAPRWLSTLVDDDLPTKARRLAQLAHAGLPVPAGLTLAPDPAALDDPDARAAVEHLLARGPVVVRSALWGEDEAEGSAAGLGRSTLGCTDLHAVRQALADLDAQRHDPWLVAYRRDPPGRDCAIVQQQIARRALLVVATAPSGPAEVEVHTAGGEALAQGRSPEYAGLLSQWNDPARPQVEALVKRTTQRLAAAVHGHDLEVVVDPEDAVHLVQARPLAAPLHPGWDQFHQTLADADQLDQLHGVLTLDAEHNPAPLSPAHAWLMNWLRDQRPSAGGPTVLAGWLYVRTLPRDLARAHARPSTPTNTPTVVEVVTQLHRDTLPHMRARLEDLTRSLAHADGPTLIEALPRAQQAFLAMIDTYTRVLIPARTRARQAQPGSPFADPAQPLSTRDRDAFLDVLPVTWDLASPSLAECGATSTGEATVLPTDEAQAATLLGEWDDHLFALGLAPLRTWILAAARHLRLPPNDAFMLTPPELARGLAEPTALPTEQIAIRRAALEHQASLRPPLRIVQGRPVSFGRRARLRGIPLGPSFTGVLAPRSDLAALLADPPAPDAIVTLPSLTAPAAVALRQLGVRAVCCEHGGPLSHAALMARELGLSALIGCRGCTELPAGHRARLDTTAGRLVLESSTGRST